MSKSLYSNKSVKMPFRIMIQQPSPNDNSFDCTTYNVYPAASWCPVRIQDAGLFYQAFRFTKLNFEAFDPYVVTGPYDRTSGFAFQNFAVDSAAPTTFAIASELPVFNCGSPFCGKFRSRVPPKLLLDGQVKWWQTHTATDIDLKYQGCFYIFTQGASDGFGGVYNVIVTGEVEFKDPINGADLLTLAKQIVVRDEEKEVKEDDEKSLVSLSSPKLLAPMKVALPPRKK